MGKFLCNGVIEFPADKMDIVASVLQKHGLKDPDVKPLMTGSHKHPFMD